MEIYNAKNSDYQADNDGASVGFTNSVRKERPLDLNDYIVHHPDSTFFMRVKGSSMSEYRIYDGDILVVDRAPVIKSGMIILGILNSAFVVKKIELQDKNIKLLSDDCSEIVITEQDQFEIWGQVLYTIHKHS